MMSQISWVPSVVLAPGSSRQRPDCGLKSDPSERDCPTWAPVPLHVQSWTFVPLAVPEDIAMRPLRGHGSARPARRRCARLPEPALTAHLLSVNLCAAGPTPHTSANGGLRAA